MAVIRWTEERDKTVYHSKKKDYISVIEFKHITIGFYRFYSGIKEDYSKEGQLPLSKNDLKSNNILALFGFAGLLLGICGQVFPLYAIIIVSNIPLFILSLCFNIFPILLNIYLNKIETLHKKVIPTKNGWEIVKDIDKNLTDKQKDNLQYHYAEKPKKRTKFSFLSDDIESNPNNPLFKIVNFIANSLFYFFIAVTVLGFIAVIVFVLFFKS